MKSIRKQYGNPDSHPFFHFFSTFHVRVLNSTLRYECDETFSDECEFAARAEGELCNHTCQENVFRTSIVRNFISRGVKMRISAREACVRTHFHTRSEIKYCKSCEDKNFGRMCACFCECMCIRMCTIRKILNLNEIEHSSFIEFLIFRKSDVIALIGEIFELARWKFLHNFCMYILGILAILGVKFMQIYKRTRSKLLF